MCFDPFRSAVRYDESGKESLPTCSGVQTDESRIRDCPLKAWLSDFLIKPTVKKSGSLLYYLNFLIYLKLLLVSL